MGSSEDDLYPKKQYSKNNTTTKHKIQILLVVIFTNLITIYILTGPSLSVFNKRPQWPVFYSQELNSTREQLASSLSLIDELNDKLNRTNVVVETLLQELTRSSSSSSSNRVQIWEGLFADQAEEVKRAIGPHKLPLGTSPTTGTAEMVPSFGAGCLRVPPEELAEYMSYEVGGECPPDDVFAQKLMLKGCEPLPRRRCRPRSPAGFPDPAPLPGSLWATPPDAAVSWHPYTCKNFACLVNRRKSPGTFDCKDCFDLAGREKTRWLTDNGGLDYGIDRVLSLKPAGSVRIGLDIGGGSGTFAARMKERGVTVVTSSMNFDAPFNGFIAARGLVPVHISVSQRLPFFENTLDIVHSMHVLSNWIPDAALEFILFDIFRVLRPGGIFWVDHFFCVGPQLNGTYRPIFDRIGFKKLRWNVGLKLDQGPEKNEIYFSALLEKPMT